MREFLSDKNFKLSKILVLVKFLLIAALIIFFLPLIILPFFNHPFADDYFCGYNLHNKSFADYQLFIYTNCGGRVASTFTGSLFAHNNFLYGHYYLHSLVLLFLNFISILFLINTICKFILKKNPRFSETMLISFLFLVLEICSLPECSTFIFWFSSAITYQFPVILIQFEIALFIIFFNSGRIVLQNIYAVVLGTLVFLTIGFNELFIIVQLFLFSIVLYFKWYRQCCKIFIPLFILAFLTATALLIFAPGSQVRLNEIDSKGPLVGIVSVCYQSAQTIWNIFKNPFLWFAGVAIFMYAEQTKEQWLQNSYVKKLSQKKWLFPAMIFLFLVFSIALPVTALKGGIIPERYLNAVVCFMLLLLLSFIFISGIITNSKMLSLPGTTKKIVLYSFFIIGILCNTYIIDAYKSLIIAPVYNTILNERESVLKQAAKGNKTAIVYDYDAALSKLLQTKYNSATATLQQLIQQKPPLLFFEDDLATKYSVDILQKYYGLDSIVIRKN